MNTLYLFIRNHCAVLVACVLFFQSCSSTDNQVKVRPSSLNKATTSIYDIQVVTLSGKPYDLNTLKGKKILIVNTASKCGNAPQYKDLQKMNAKYGDQVVVLGFPCNDFGGQEFTASDEISAFCKKNYGVTFQMFEKIIIKGPNKHPLYDWLTDPAKNGWNSEAPTWNFCKYLIDENGELIKYYGPGIIPSTKEVLGIDE
ncbi:MAG: glutathione peroxidase [Cytophagales bacterium]|nr:glutathione peroxidase [Cytophaga sp.]